LVLSGLKVISFSGKITEREEKAKGKERRAKSEERRAKSRSAEPGFSVVWGK